MQDSNTIESQTVEPFWGAIVQRDRSFEGRFWYSVATTGVFCRPSCPSRLPRRENVTFHPSPEQAIAAGYRPCKRCKPCDDPLAGRVAEVEKLCRMIESASEPLTTRDLARALGASPSHTHRLFKEVTGVTPRKYATESRRQRLKEPLQTAPSITSAIYSSGQGSPSRFYRSVARDWGMKPRAYRAGGEGEAIQFAIAESALGPLLVARTARGICWLSLGEDPQVLIDELTQHFPQATLATDPHFDELVSLVVGHVEDPKSRLDLPLDIRGTAFQQRVWAALMKIPLGTTTTYSELAERIGAPQSARAVARACATNVLAVAVPCHRVVRRDGGLSGYRWGVERKRELLERERR